MTSCCQPSKCKFHIVHVKSMFTRLTIADQKSTQIIITLDNKQSISIDSLWFKSIKKVSLCKFIVDRENRDCVLTTCLFLLLLV